MTRNKIAYLIVMSLLASSNASAELGSSYWTRNKPKVAFNGKNCDVDVQFEVGNKKPKMLAVHCERPDGGSCSLLWYPRGNSSVSKLHQEIREVGDRKIVTTTHYKIFEFQLTTNYGTLGPSLNKLAQKQCGTPLGKPKSVSKKISEPLKLPGSGDACTIEITKVNEKVTAAHAICHKSSGNHGLYCNANADISGLDSTWTLRFSKSKDYDYPDGSNISKDLIRKTLVVRDEAEFREDMSKLMLKHCEDTFPGPIKRTDSPQTNVLDAESAEQ